MYENHVPEKWKDKVPHVVRNEAGVDEWEFQGQKTSTPFGMAATVGWPREEWGFNPGAYSELRPGCFDVHERVRDMNANGVLASMNFPTMAGFNARTFHEAGDKEVALDLAAGLQRLGHRRVGGQLPGPVHPPRPRPDVGRRPRRRGGPPHRQEGLPVDQLPRDPARPGLPELPVRPLGPDDAGPVRREHGPVAAHRRRLRRDQPARGGPDRPPHGAGLPDQRRSPPRTCCSGRPCGQFPDLKVALSEGGIGWIPFYFDRIDRHFQNQSWLHGGDDFGGKMPSEVFREHILACYITDPSGLLLRDRIGIDIIAWECDYPHTDTTWPESPEFAWKELQDAGCARRGDPQDHLGERLPVLRLGPVRAHQEGGRHGRRPPGAGRRRGRDPHAPGRVEEAERGRRHRRLLTAPRVVEVDVPGAGWR